MIKRVFVDADVLLDVALVSENSGGILPPVPA